jgi:hypothetical protein
MLCQEWSAVLMLSEYITRGERGSASQLTPWRHHLQVTSCLNQLSLIPFWSQASSFGLSSTVWIQDTLRGVGTIQKFRFIRRFVCSAFGLLFWFSAVAFLLIFNGGFEKLRAEPHRQAQGWILTIKLSCCICK